MDGPEVREGGEMLNGRVEGRWMDGGKRPVRTDRTDGCINR